MNQEKQTFKEYWKTSWKKGYIIYFFAALLVFLIMILAVKFTVKRFDYYDEINKIKHYKLISWKETLSIVGIVMICFNLLAIFFKYGLGNGFVRMFKRSARERKIRRNAKTKYTLGMSIAEKDKILADERERYEYEESKSFESDNQNPKKRNGDFAFFFLIIIGLLLLLSLI
ncbi:uncharacterized protein DUF3899 [Metamycoplasma subdolum]|uniref:Uncharacterized protein DUF3899 n=1 Tax=Metamycoplasma subdolum TaxID=92407 RepID=A0A3M0A0F7_9BACT|nr:DUF3899 domain-containing protein [Metamycoplasma subdolum]RMA78611.1 uncharacterized protein DUF3899 [Metamycoplasma subdolum]WPB50254.1 DUF3899 domain-containing protein [Metamycoplasma subdolum]